jgi:hypothetical protein
MSRLRSLRRQVLRSRKIAKAAAVPMVATGGALSASSIASAQPTATQATAPARHIVTDLSNGCANETPLVHKKASLSGGGNRYSVQIGDTPGTLISPPTGFKPLLASDAELSEYGFPPRPKGPSALRQWRSMMAHYKSTASPTGMNAESCPRAASAIAAPNEAASDGSPTQAATSASDDYQGSAAPSINWSGYLVGTEAYPEANISEFDAIQGAWTQPGAGPCSCSTTSGATWIGMGGALDFGIQSSQLIQAGTVYNVNGVSHGGFYEWIGNTPDESVQALIIPGMTVNPGDLIEAQVEWYGDTDAYFWVFDETSGIAGPGGEFSVPSAYNGSMAEWIEEDPSSCFTIYNCLSDLENFGSVTFENLGVELTSTGDWKNINQVDNYSLAMTENNGEPNSPLMAAPYYVDPNTLTFTDYWFRCH